MLDSDDFSFKRKPSFAVRLSLREERERRVEHEFFSQCENIKNHVFTPGASWFLNKIKSSNPKN